MSRKKAKAFSTPQGLRYGASISFSNAALAWIANLIWQVIQLFIRASGFVSVLLSLIGFAFLLYGALISYNAFEYEIQANAMENEKTDRLLPILKKGIMACIIIRAVLVLISVVLSLLFSTSQGTTAWSQLNGLINLLGDLFTTVNILGIFAYHIFIKEGYEQKIKVVSLLSFITVLAHLLLAELCNFLRIRGLSASGLSYVTLFAAVISYLCLFWMFEARKALYKPQSEDSAQTE